MDTAKLINTSYSTVIFDYAEKNNKLKEIREQAHFVLDTLLLEGQIVYETLRDYNILKQSRKDLLSDLFKDKIDAYFLYTLQTIVDFNRCSYFITILKQTLHLLSKALNIRYIKVITAFELDEAQVQKLQDALKAYYNASEIDIKIIVNPAIIGGLKIISEEDSINTSFISRLINIHEKSINLLSRYKKEDK